MSMKKASRLLVLLLTFIMVLSMCACGGGDAGKDLVGTWSLDYDIASIVEAELGDEYTGFHSPLEMSIRFDFREDKSFTMYGEETSFTENYNKWVDAFIVFSVDMMYTEFSNQGLDKDAADAAFQEAYGTGIEEFLRQTFAEELDVNSLLQEMTTNGKYETSGNKLYLGMDGEEIDKSAYDVFTVSGDTLKLELPQGAANEEILPGLAYPLELKKVN